MWSEVTDTLLDDLRHDGQVRGELGALEQQVADGTIPAATAARRLLRAFLPD